MNTKSTRFAAPVADEAMKSIAAEGIVPGVADAWTSYLRSAGLLPHNKELNESDVHRLQAIFHAFRAGNAPGPEQHRDLVRSALSAVEAEGGEAGWPEGGADA